jgi:hypothetical protein
MHLPVAHLAGTEDLDLGQHVPRLAGQGHRKPHLIPAELNRSDGLVLELQPHLVHEGVARPGWLAGLGAVCPHGLDLVLEDQD